MSILLKILIPFVKEMIIGKNSFRYALRKNRIRVLFFISVILSYGLNWFFIPKTFIISAAHIEQTKLLASCNSSILKYTDDVRVILDQDVILKKENAALKETCNKPVESIQKKDEVKVVKTIENKTAKEKKHKTDKQYNIEDIHTKLNSTKE